MEQDSTQTPHKPIRIDPPAEAGVSTFFNGVSNGIMIGASPTIVWNLFDRMRGKHLSEIQEKAHGKWGLAFATAGCAIGAVFGIREAQRLKDYRDKMSDKVAELEGSLETQRVALQQWRDKATANKEEAISTTRA